MKAGIGLSRRRMYGVLATVTLGYFATQLPLTGVPAILPTLARVFHADAQLAAWTSTAYFVPLTGFLLIAGRLGDAFGRRTIFGIGAVLFTISSLLSGLASSIWPFLVTRGIQGLASALMIGNAAAIVSDVFPEEERGRAIGLLSMSAALGAITGMLLGPAFVETLSWRWLFFVMLPFGLGSLWGTNAIGGLRREDGPASTRQIDWLGSTFLLLALVSFSLSFSHLHGGEETFSDGAPYHLTMNALTVLFLVALFLVERRHPRPLLILSQFRNRTFTLGVASNGLLHMTMMVAIYVTPFLTEKGMGLSPMHSAAILVAYELCYLIFSPIAGHIYDRTRSALLGPSSFFIVASGLTVLGLLASGLSYGTFLAIAFYMGIGLGLYLTPVTTQVMNSLPAEVRGFGSGMLETTRQLGHSVAVLVPTLIIGNTLTSDAPDPVVLRVGFRQSWFAMGALAAFGIATSWLASRDELLRYRGLKAVAVEDARVAT